MRNEQQIREENREELMEWFEDGYITEEQVNYLLNLEIYDNDVIMEMANAFNYKFTKEKAEYLLSKNLNKKELRTLIFVLSKYEIKDIEYIVNNHLDCLAYANSDMFAKPDQVIFTTNIKIDKKIIKEDVRGHLTFANFRGTVKDCHDRIWLQFKIPGEHFGRYEILVLDKNAHDTEYWNKKNIEEFINKVDKINIDDTELLSSDEIREMKVNNTLPNIFTIY